jgi:hypothetical protein
MDLGMLKYWDIESRGARDHAIVGHAIVSWIFSRVRVQEPQLSRV